MRKYIFVFFLVLNHLLQGQICPPSSGTELITNGDFESGTTGFNSDYTLTTGSPPSIGPGGYGVWSNPSQTNSFYANMSDHTSGAGTQMLIVDVDGTFGKDAYNTTVNVLPNTTYFFSAWFANINTNTSCASCGGIYFENSPILRFSINNIQVGSTVYVDSASHNWGQFFVAWNSGATSGNITIRIENIRTGSSNGNDLALDDISFSTSCSNISNIANYGNTSTLPDTIYACNEAYPLTLDPLLTAANYTFQWKNSGGTVLSTSSTYTFSSAPTAGTYYLCYDSIGDNVTCPRTDSFVVLNELNVDIKPDQTLCDPISYTINSNITASGVTFAWTRNGTSVGGNTSTLTATDIGTYGLTVSKSGCPNASSSMTISRITPTLTGSGSYCNTSTPNFASFTVSGGNKISNALNIKWYTTSSGGSALTTNILNDSTIEVSSPNYVSVAGCNYGLYAEDQNSFNTNVSQAVNLSNESIRSATDTRTMITVSSASLTINSIQIYQNNYSTGGNANYTVRIYSNASGSRCGPNGNVPGSIIYTASISGTFPKVTTPTLRTVPVNITLTGTSSGTLYWIEVTGDEFSYFTTSPSWPATNSPGSSVLSINDVISQTCPQTQMGNVININATAGKTNSCGRVFVCATNLDCSLPVEFIKITAHSSLTGTEISWSTANEDNNSYLIVQKSIDGSAFEDIDVVKESESSSIVHDYSYIDTDVSSGIIYYRIKQVDTDGKNSFSNIISIKNLAIEKVMFYPVPSTSGDDIKFTVSGFSGRVILRIFDAIGKEIYIKEITLNESAEGSINTNLSKGIYFAEIISSDSSKKVGKIIIE